MRGAPQRKSLRRVLGTLGLLAGSAGVLLLVLILIPYPELDAYRQRPYGVVVTDRHGLPLRVTVARDGVKREWADLETIPKGAQRIFIRAEDRRFRLHPGIDPPAVLGSAVRNLRARRVVSGASTISMQLARLVRPRAPGWRGKLAEALDALRLEARLSKDDILELWLNGIPFGGNIEGLPAMARARFGRSVAELDDAEAALLAVVPRRPAAYDPARHAVAAVAAALDLARRGRLNLDREDLVRAAAAAAEPDGRDGDRAPFRAPHFVDRVALELPPGRRAPVRTTLDGELQAYAEALLRSELETLAANRLTNGAVLAIDNASGAVRVYVGSADWFDSEHAGQIDGVRVTNQPGSCLKPFLYALALDRGFLPNDILPDLPSVFGGAQAYIPANFNRRFNGPVRLRLALASSLNVPAVYLLERLGVGAFEDYLISLGFDSVAQKAGTHGTGLALGNAEVGLEELVRAFAAFPRGGSLPERRFLEEEAPAPEPPAALAPGPGMSPYAAWTIADILSDSASRFVGFGPAAALRTPFPAMFKTGTANQFQHIWALGATRRFTVGVWMGNFSGETVVGKTGSSVPARITAELLDRLEAADDPREQTAGGAVGGPVPPGTVEVELCPLSGQAAGAYCTGTIRERLPADRIPPTCTWHRPGDSSAALVYPPEYRAWLAERRRFGATETAPSDPESYIRRPVDGAVFYLDPSLPPSAQSLRLDTVGFGPEALVFMNGEPVGVLDAAGGRGLPLLRGQHRLLVSEGGRTAETRYEVR